MRLQFKGYYPPSSEEFTALWESGKIVIDTNVLLNSYRLPPDARDEFLNVLEGVSDRIWIPHQVGLEFQINRVKVIGDKKNTINDALTKIQGKIEEVQTAVRALEIGRHQVDITEDGISSKLVEIAGQISSAIRKVSDSYADIASSDPIRDRIDGIIGEKIGEAPSSVEDVAALVANGEDRYAKGIPPGFKDSGKGGGPDGGKYYFGDLELERKYGDLIIWRQVIQWAKSNSIKSIMLVTGDKKEDWWRLEKGRTLGPHPGLIQEICLEAEVDVFWMYSADQFVENAKKFISAKISDRSVEELKDVAQLRSPDFRPDPPHSQLNALSALYAATENLRRDDSALIDGGPTAEFLGDDLSEEPSFASEASAELAVFRWLSEKYPDLRRNRTFPDFTVGSEIVQGFEVKATRNFRQMLFPPSVVHALLRGYLEVTLGRLSEFTLVFVVPLGDLDSLYALDKFDELRRRTTSIADRYPAGRIIVGAIQDGIFLQAVEV